MFIPCDDNKLIHFGNFTHVWLGDDGKTRAIDRDGDTFLLPDYDLETVETMSCPIIPAGEGFVKLFFSFKDNSFQEHPVLAWRLRTPFAPEPISLFDDQFTPPGITAVRYPDGRVIAMNAEGNAEMIRDMESWRAYADREWRIWNEKT